MLIALNKPFRVLSQFTCSEGRRTLAEFIAQAGVYPVGRLDFDSEGLLLLSDDGQLIRRLAHPASGTEKTYLVQVEGEPRPDQLARLAKGITLNDGPTLPAEVRPVPVPEWLWPREPPVRFRKSVPDTWLELSLREGRNRQVRRMTAKVGLPTLRLIRVSVGPYGLDDLAPGATRVLDATPAAQPIL